jgi:hypothetical protein
MIVYAAAWNDTITRAQLRFPSYRDLGDTEISPLNATAIPSALFRSSNWGQYGPKFRKNEELQAKSSNGASTVDIINICALIVDSLKPVPSGRKFTVSGTAAQTLVAQAWTRAAIALDQNLPYGVYAVIGLRVVCAAAFAARLVFPNMLQYRPGVAVGNTEAVSDYQQPGRQGQWGEWGRFEQTAPPLLEVLGTTAGAQTPRAYIDLVEIGSGSLAA